MNKANLARDFITNNPTVKSKRAIAKELMVRYPEQFQNIEQARASVRLITGTIGDKNRAEYKDHEKIRFFYNGFEKWQEENLNTENRPWDEPYIIPKQFKHLNVISDLHSVYLDGKVMTAFLKRTSDKEAILINGDLMDSESLSRHLISHNAVEYDRETDICRQILIGLKQEFTHVYFKEGNHDFWLERYLLINSRAMINTFKERGVNVYELLQCGSIGVHHIHNLQSWQYHDLEGIHGHEFPGFGMGKFPATGLLDKWQTFKKRIDVKILGSHCHMNDHAISKKSKDGKFGEAWITPAMCKSFAYNPYKGNDQGWAELIVNNDDKVEVKMTVL